ncbi:glycoside hydrolase family 78 protein [Cohnella thailandensis]|uniref:alpha-L-rhamnosidase n=1 Tax=Cohnella thailandensis TaxID=557557 RepID=A0A841T470_9BACL|nr:glycoside hydrolase family 78 protein [Cohnella thailandensis]MBB6637148.1 family 78 glycoside hydrolase catalytic domain [Cohnella thailandensis]MBP1977034.1 alpha-L-rhamnosidase [Cohnella thailandensis]
MLEAYCLRTEYRENPLGLDTKKPRLGWKLRSDKANVMQIAYRLQFSSNPHFTDVAWDSGRTETSQSQHVRHDGLELKSAERVYWRVKVWCSHGEESSYSSPSYFETGLLEASDWKARWIEPEKEVDPDAYKPAPYIRKEFSVKKGLVSARAYLTAKGLYSFYLNGVEGTDDLFTPGFTSYLHRLQYQAYDVTSLLKEGANALGIVLGDGWWRGATGGANLKNNFGYKVAFLGQLLLEYEDGSREIIGSDETFKASRGPLLKSDMKAGEIYDARIGMEGWNEPGYDDSAWEPVHVTEDGLDSLIATRSVPVREKERFTPSVLRTPNGETVLDFGQNIAGYVDMKVRGEAGTEIVLIHGEALDKHGNFTLSNLSEHGTLEDFQEVHYILAGKGEERYRPRFSIFGFRYVLVKNYPGDVTPENFTAVAVYSDLEETGDFTCSNPLLNKLVSNSRWSQKSNFMEVPTDCPTRERAGWTGDAQVFSRTAADFMNVYPFFEKWMSDLAVEQFQDGSVGSTVPTVLGYHNLEEWERLSKTSANPMMAFRKPGTASMLDGSSGWGDAAVIVPWTMYLCYGDKTIIENQFDSAKAWVDYMADNARNPNPRFQDTPAYRNRADGERDADYIWDTRFHFGEWLETDTEMKDLAALLTKTGGCFPDVSTAYFAYSARLLSEMARVIGKAEEAEKYQTLHKKIKRVYNTYFIQEDGTILDGRQAPNVRTLAFDLAEEEKKQAVADRLAQMVIEQEYRLNTGFLSTPFILHALADSGYEEIAYRLLEQESCPSWLYAVRMGATTIWESWRGIKPDGELAGSLNHYSYGAACDFLFAGAAGIRPEWDRPGFKHFVLKPIVGGTLTHASATYESLYGTIKSSWEKTGQGVAYRFEVPANTTATIMLPGEPEDLKKGLEEFPDVRYEDGRIAFTAGSGSYQFTI